MIDSLHRADIARYTGKTELVVLPAPNPRHVRPTDFAHTQSLIEGALVGTRTFLAERHAAESSALRPASAASPLD